MNIKTFTIHSARNVFAFFIALGLGYVAYTVNPGSVAIPKAEAAPTALTGYAWTDTVGWISFSGTATDGSPYSVNLDPDTGDFSGNAWSSDIDTAPNPDQGGIGWISFDRSRTGNPPADPYRLTAGAIAKVDLVTGNVTGWARALAACTQDALGNLVPAQCAQNSNAGGWDGWIKLSDTWTNPVKINPSDGKFSGYAWGGAKVLPSGDSDPIGVSVIGWVNFSGTAQDGSSYSVQGPQFNCSNGAINPSACNQCANGDFYNTVSLQCYSCSGTGCSGTGGTTTPGNEFGSLICNGGTTNVPGCNTCPTLQILSGGACVPSVNNGTCDVAAGENLTNSPADCKPKTKFWQF